MRYTILDLVGTEEFIKAYLKNGEAFEISSWGVADDRAWIHDCDTSDGCSFRNWEIIDIG